jgi:hypothetical protein
MYCLAVELSWLPRSTEESNSSIKTLLYRSTFLLPKSQQEKKRENLMISRRNLLTCLPWFGEGEVRKRRVRAILGIERTGENRET